MNHGNFKKPRPRNYALDEDNEMQELDLLGEALDHPNTYHRSVTNVTGVEKNKVLRTLKKHRFKPYRVRKVHQLRNRDHQRRVTFCEWYVGKYRMDFNFHMNIIWTDECRIDTSGIHIRYSSYYWDIENPHITVPVNRQGRVGFHIWLGIFQGRFLGPHFYYGNLKAEDYVNVLETYVPLAQARNIYYKQDGCTPHNARVSTNF